MKFAKVLSAQAASVLPGGLQTLFPYKAFKKHISTWAEQCDAAEALGAHPDVVAQQQQQLAACQQELLRMLSAELQRLNQTLMEREELLVMSWQVLEEEAARAMQPQSQQPSVDHQHLQDLLQLLVNFHGDAVMLLNWSHVNFSAVVKALKKFDKRTGSCLRTPLMQHVLRQPFCCVDVVNRLAQGAERRVNELTTCLQSSRGAGRQQAQPKPCLTEPVQHASATAVSAPKRTRELPDDTCDCDSACTEPGQHCGHRHCQTQMAECAVMSKRIRAALDTWQGLAGSAHTPSTVILPSATATASKV